jgi:hypothetical protein
MKCVCAVLCGLPRSKTFFYIIAQTHDFRRKKEIIEHEIVFRVSIHLSEIFFCYKRTERDMIENVYLPSSKVPDILVRFF